MRAANSEPDDDEEPALIDGITPGLSVRFRRDFDLLEPAGVGNLIGLSGMMSGLKCSNRSLFTFSSLTS